MSDKVVLAYSGGLDTTVAIGWLKQNKGLETIAVAVDVGQPGDMDQIVDRALKAGAVEAYAFDAAERFADGYLTKAINANALYQGKYPLVSALSRPLIAECMVEAARKEGANYVAHGCTGKGNDQVRFEVSLGALAPELEVIAPIREWGMTRDQAIDFGLEHGLPITVGPASPYSIDENMWGRTIECGALEDPWVSPPDDIWERTVSPSDAPREPDELEVTFDAGVPTALDGRPMSLATIVAEVDRRAGAYGIGRVDMIEDRVVGIKSREIYEVPGAIALIRAHSELEELTLDREALKAKRRLEIRYAELVYEGLWFSQLREAMDAFNGSVAANVTGKVRLKLEPGSATVVGRSSESSMYDLALATYDQQDAFDHKAGEGFVKIWGLPSKIWGRVQRNRD